MGQTSGKLYDATTQKTRDGIHAPHYTEVTMAKVDFAAHGERERRRRRRERGGGRRASAGPSRKTSASSRKPSKLKVEGMLPHPSDAVENGTLATVAPPDVTYKLNIAEDMPHVISEGRPQRPPARIRDLRPPAARAAL